MPAADKPAVLPGIVKDVLDGGGTKSVILTPIQFLQHLVAHALAVDLGSTRCLSRSERVPVSRSSSLSALTLFLIWLLVFPVRVLRMRFPVRIGAWIHFDHPPLGPFVGGIALPAFDLVLCQ